MTILAALLLIAGGFMALFAISNAPACLTIRDEDADE